MAVLFPVLFLVPASALIGLLLLVAMPAWHAHPLNPLQLLFDLGFAIVIAGVAAGWRTRFSPAAGHRVLRMLLLLGALVGAAGAAIAALHLLLGIAAGAWVGYALLGPGVLLVPLLRA